MPVKLADRALAQVLLRAGNVVARGQVGDDLLAHPAAFEDARLGVGEAPFQVGHGAGVGRLLAQVVGVLQVERLVGAACVQSALFLLSGRSGTGRPGLERLYLICGRLCRPC